MRRDPLSHEDFLESCRDDMRAEWADEQVRLISPLSAARVGRPFLVTLIQMIVEYERGGSALFKGAHMHLAEQRRDPGRTSSTCELHSSPRMLPYAIRLRREET